MFEDLRCPKCGAANLVAEKRGFNAVKGVAGGLLGGVLLGPLGALAGGGLAGTARQNDIYLTCLNCKHQFSPQQANRAQAGDNTRQSLDAGEAPSAPVVPRCTKIEW